MKETSELGGSAVSRIKILIYIRILYVQIPASCSFLNDCCHG